MKTINKELFKSTTLIKLVLFLFLGVFTTGQLKSQSSYTINTVGSTFSPSSLTINVGDTVTWNNTGGSHNVNGYLATFPR